MTHLYTTHGALSKDQLGIILPHEHIFVDLRTPDVPEQGQAKKADVVALMQPELEALKPQGVSALVECTPEGCARNVEYVKAVAMAADFPVVVPTGIYRQPWVPQWAINASQDFLYDWMRKELEVGIGETGVQAGFIKLSAGDDGLTAVEEKILRAAVHAARRSNALIASHTIHAAVVRQQIAVMEEEGFALSRFVWIHAQVDTLEENLALAPLGLWIEYDHVDGTDENDGEVIRRIRALVDAGFEDQILLSMDRGWYDPAKPGGGTPMPFTLLVDSFVPRLRAAGFSQAMIDKFTMHNPFNAFAR